MRIVFLLFCFISCVVVAQDRVLLSISDQDISVDDFMATYYKNKLDSDTLKFEDSLQEYLNLYINFKLKVIEAEALGMDTVPSFLSELEGYRKQLSKPYLTDREVSDELLQEAYNRLKYEVSASHILIQTTGQDTLVAYNRIMDIKSKLNDTNSNFDLLAKQYSEDPSAKDNNGDLGYFSALYMVYPFENASFNTSVGQIAGPIRTIAKIVNTIGNTVSNILADNFVPKIAFIPCYPV